MGRQGTVSRRAKVGIISIHPAPYRDPTFTELARKEVLKVTVLSLFDGDAGHPRWDLGEMTYPNTLSVRRDPAGRRRWATPRMLALLRTHRFDVVLVPGHAYLALLAATLYCMLTRTPYIYSTDKIQDRPKPTIVTWMGSLISRVIWSKAAAFWVPGRASRDYLRSKGVEDQRLFEGCYTLDALAIGRSVAQARDQRQATRQRFAADEQAFVFLMVANVLPRRRHDLLLESFMRVAAESPRACLWLVGTGTDSATLGRLSGGKEHKNVRFIGPVSFAALAPLYAAADAYVHTGKEPYSTAVAYGALAGLPIITTYDVGAARDFLIEGETGFLIGSDAVSGLAEKMLLLARDGQTARRLGRNAQAVAHQFTCERAADQLEQAVALATGFGRGTAPGAGGADDAAT